MMENFNEAWIQDFITWVDRCAKTSRTYQTNMKSFITWLRYEQISAPARQDILLYRDWLSSEHDAILADDVTGWTYRRDQAGRPIKVMCKASTVKGYLQTVRAFFRWTATENLYPDIAAGVHLPRIRTNRHKKDALTPSDVCRIESNIQRNSQARAEAAGQAVKDPSGRLSRATEQGARLYAMYLLAVTAGLRTIELHRANVGDLEVRDGQAWLYIYGKGSTEPDQKKALAPETYQAIRDYLQIRSDKPTASSPLFVATGNRSGGKRIAVTTISTLLKRALQDAGYDSDRLTAHSLRHTAGTAVMQMTGNLFDTQMYMRHSTPTTTEIYIHAETDQKDAAIAGDLYGYYHGQDTHKGLRAILDALTPAELAELARLAAVKGGVAA